MNGMQNTPVYPYKASFAKKYNQMFAWQQSWEANVQCSHDLNSLIRRVVLQKKDSDTFKSIIIKYGPERPMFLVAMAVKEMVKCGKGEKLDLYLKKWAASVYTQAELRGEFLLKATPENLNALALFCREQESLL